MENVCAIGMPAEMRDALWSRVSGRKNRSSIMALADWIVEMGHVFRTREGFSLVRGSDKGSTTGLKERPELQERGLTADKIRGAYEALVDVEFLRSETPEVPGGWRRNYRQQPRRPSTRYWIAEEFVALFKAGIANLKAAVVQVTMAAKAVASSALSGVRQPSLISVASSSSPPKCQSQDMTPIPGDIRTSYGQRSIGSRQEPLPAASPPRPEARPISDFDRRMEALRIEVEAIGRRGNSCRL